MHYATKSDGGYLLYSVGSDHIDNGGTGIDGGTVNGEWMENPPSVDLDACDIVIRMPKPPTTFPVIPLRADDEEELGGSGADSESDEADSASQSDED